MTEKGRQKKMALEEYRNEIDRIDRELIEKLEERMRVAEKIAAYKKENGSRIFDPLRERALLDKVTALSAADMASSLRTISKRSAPALVSSDSPISSSLTFS